MKKQVAFRGRIANGEIHYFKPKEREKAIKDLEGQDIVERIETVGDDVSANQRAYYFATNRYLIKEQEAFGGWSEDDVDNYAREMFLSTVHIHKEGNVGEVTFKKIKSIKEIDKEEMSKFINAWLDYLSFTHGIYCPSVEEILLSKYQ
jgi:hypothetical protein